MLPTQACSHTRKVSIHTTAHRLLKGILNNNISSCSFQFQLNATHALKLRHTYHCIFFDQHLTFNAKLCKNLKHIQIVLELKSFQVIL